MEAIREYLKATGQNQSEFAARVGASRSAVSLWIRGKRQPSDYQLYRIHRETGIALEKLRKP